MPRLSGNEKQRCFRQSQHREDRNKPEQVLNGRKLTSTARTKQPCHQRACDYSYAGEHDVCSHGQQDVAAEWAYPMEFLPTLADARGEHSRHRSRCMNKSLSGDPFVLSRNGIFVHLVSAV